MKITTNIIYSCEYKVDLIIRGRSTVIIIILLQVLGQALLRSSSTHVLPLPERNRPAITHERWQPTRGGGVLWCVSSVSVVLLLTRPRQTRSDGCIVCPSDWSGQVDQEVPAATLIGQRTMYTTPPSLAVAVRFKVDSIQTNNSHHTFL